MATFNLTLNYSPTNDILPASGFTGSTSTPGQVGSGSYATENVIGQADYVPYQTHASTFRIGAKMNHINGMDRVDAIIDGGKPKACTYGTNPDTGVVEHYITIDPSHFSDGLHECRFIGYPVAGVPRVISGMFFNTNYGGTLPGLTKYISPSGNDTTGDGSNGNPWKTMTGACVNLGANAAGATVYMKAGEYVNRGRVFGESPISNTRWVTFTIAPGLSRGDVIIHGKEGLAGDDGGMGMKLIRVYNVTLDEFPIGSVDISGDAIWFDTCDMYHADGRFFPTGSPAPTEWIEGQFENRYATDCTVHDMPSAPDGVTLWRNSTITRIVGSCFHETPAVFNCTLEDSDPLGNTDVHPDVCQYANDATNVVWYGITAIGTPTNPEPIDSFGVRFNNAVRDVLIENCTLKVNAPTVAGFGTQSYRNYYWKGNTLSPGFEDATGGSPNITSCVFDGNTFYSAPPALTGITVR